MKKLKYHYSSFQKLSLEQLYNIMVLRQEVFVVEQTCPYLDADGKDFASIHLMGYDEDDVLLSYARIVPPGISYEHHASIGRVVTAASIRGTKEGYTLMEKSIALCKKYWADSPIKISAQAHLENFYTKCGFTAEGETYLEDDIPHIAMTFR